MCRLQVAGAALAGLAIAATAAAQQHDHSMHQHDQATPPEASAQAHLAVPVVDTRQAVEFSQAMRDHTLANMRDHLLALQQIQSALAKEEYDQAADIAEQRLGMTALILHGSYERAKFMPQGMRDVGSAMHANASRLAVAAKDAGATGDLRPVLEAMASVTAQCVACHSAYRVK
jgi:outer membrane receptor for monomeric catechols